MESELIMSPCLLVRAMVKTMFGIIKMWCPVKGAFTTGRANVAALSWEKKNVIMIKKLLFFSSICPVLSGCTRGPCSHLLPRPLKESFTGVTLPAKQTGGVWRGHVKSCRRSSRNQKSWLLISWELTWGTRNHRACETQSNHTELSLCHLHLQQFLFREMPCAYGNICLYSQLTFNLS